MIGDERALIDTIRKRQRKWIGHTCRLRGVLLLRTAIQWKMDGKKTRNNLLSLLFYNNFYFISFYASVSSSLYHFLIKKRSRGRSREVIQHS